MTRIAPLALLVLAGLLPACQSVRPPVAADPWARFARSHEPVAAGGEPVLDPLALAPADTRFFIHIRDLARLRTNAKDDPLATYLIRELSRIERTQLWTRLRQSFGLDGDALFDRMFGRSLAFIGTRASTKSPYMALSVVGHDDLQRLPAALKLQSHPLLPGVGRFDLFYAPDDDVVLAMSQRLLAVADAEHLEHLAKVLLFASDAIDAAARRAAGSPVPDAATRALIDEPTLRRLFDKLPPSPQGALYARNASGDERHAVAILRNRDQIEVHYAATIPKFNDLEEQFALGSGIDFGLLPADTISAASINLRKTDDRDIDFMNWFLFPRSLGRHILPRLAAPVLAFMVRVPADRIEPNPGVDIPAFGVAVRVTDPAVAADMDRLVMAVHFLLHLSELDLGKSLFGKARQVGGATPFKMADFGQALLRHIDDPQIRRLLQLPAAGGLGRVSFGRIGQWYVVCTHDALFRQCAEAWTDHTQRLTSTAAFAALPMQPRDGLIVSIVSRAPELSRMLDDAEAYLKKTATPAERPEAKPAKTPAADATGDQPQEDAEPASDAEARINALAAELLGETDPDPDADPQPQKRAARTDPIEDDDDSMAELRRPMRRIARSIERSHSFAVQVWRDEQGDVRGLLRFFAK